MNEFTCEGRYPPLNLPGIDGRLRHHEGRIEIFDATRRKFVALTPEEWVRQHFAEYLVNHRGVPRTLTGIEISLKVAGLNKRCDILISNNTGKPCILVECKAPQVAITQSTFDQVARYNLALGIPWLMITNGMVHYACRLAEDETHYAFSPEIPTWETALK
jgi:hypothetical protein